VSRKKKEVTTGIGRTNSKHWGLGVFGGGGGGGGCGFLGVLGLVCLVLGGGGGFGVSPGDNMTVHRKKTYQGVVVLTWQGKEKKKRGP